MTGGELFASSALAQTTLTANQIMSELRHQYVLAFEASSKPGWRPLEVRTRQESLIVRARTGYHGGTPASEEVANGDNSTDQPAPESPRASSGRRQWQ